MDEKARVRESYRKTPSPASETFSPIPVPPTPARGACFTLGIPRGTPIANTLGSCDAKTEVVSITQCSLRCSAPVPALSDHPPGPTLQALRPSTNLHVGRPAQHTVSDRLERVVRPPRPSNSQSVPVIAWTARWRSTAPTRHPAQPARSGAAGARPIETRPSAPVSHRLGQNSTPGCSQNKANFNTVCLLS